MTKHRTVSKKTSAQISHQHLSRGMETTSTSVILGLPSASGMLPRSSPLAPIGNVQRVGDVRPYAESLDKGAVPNCRSDCDWPSLISGSISRLSRVVQIS